MNKILKFIGFVPTLIILIGLVIIYQTSPIMITPLKIMLVIIAIIALILGGIRYFAKKKWQKIIIGVLNVIIILFIAVGATFTLRAYKVMETVTSTPSSEETTKVAKRDENDERTEDLNADGVIDEKDEEIQKEKEEKIKKEEEKAKKAKEEKEEKDIQEENINILISGTDTRTDSINTNSKSDVIMVATLNTGTKDIVLTSLPRDTYYPLTCTGEYDKLTHASEFGMSCLESTVESILDINIDNYVKVNFTAVINAVNAVGGITVNVDQAFCGQNSSDVKNAYCFTPGSMHMNGEQALSYARERKSFSDGDYTRAYHQQQVLESFLYSLLANPGAIDELFTISEQSVRTDLTVDQLKDLFNLLISTPEMSTTNIVVQGSGSTVDIAYQGLYGTNVQVLNQSSLENAQAQIQNTYQ